MTGDLEQRRAELLRLRERLHHAAEDITADDVGEGELSSAAGDQHLGDYATDMVDRELDESLEENAERVIEEIDKALRSIDEGSYGTCTVCGAMIPDERLAAVPYATLCVDDRRKQEHR